MKWNKKTVERRIAEGRGRGEGASYRPWIETRDVSSSGRKHLVTGSRFGREIHLLSDIEFRLFLMLEWADNVIELREQYPLELDLTLLVAQKLEIKHPTYPGTSDPAVMTVDFMVTTTATTEKKYIAFNAKADSEADDARSMEKLEIQRTALEAMQVGHFIVFGSMLPKQKTANLEWIRGANLKPGELEQWPGYFDEMAQRFMLHLQYARHASPTSTLMQSCGEFDEIHEAIPGTGIRVARMLMSRKTVLFDLHHPRPQDIELAALDLRYAASDATGQRLASAR